MRTFQFSDAKSHKFWTIDVSGNAFTVTYGKVGTAGQTQTKTFATPEKAQAEADKLIREKTGKGYTETTAAPPASPAQAFEKSLQENPHDVAGWSAFADYLAENEDVRGEFMQVQLALEDESLSPAARKKLQRIEKELLAKHEREWLGPLAKVILDVVVPVYDATNPQATRPPVAHRFIRGWLGRLEFHYLTVAQARALAADPGSRLIREIVVETIANEAQVGQQEQYIDSYYEPGPDVPADIVAWSAPGLHALCRCPHLGSLRLFQLGEAVIRPAWNQDREYCNCHTPGELAYHLVKQMPNLEELYLLAHRVDANKIFPLPMPRLRTLQLYHSLRYPLDKLATNTSLTNLTTLLCHPHAIEYHDEDDERQGAYIRFPHLKAICRSPHLKSLTHLTLRLTDFGDKGAKEIVDSGILKRLKVLDLQSGCITDKGAKLLAACPDLKNLEYLNLRSNALTPAGVKLITDTGVRATVTEQHTETSVDPDGGELPEFLFEGDIE